ncbi:hypothetical protein K1T71_013529 [Dendrolimus kikuchii]|uniref:Uncharacterized protein n=1 Tax=Dendrolimus kikuchii TaxID=765133 RepID=A0ACC1CGY8_9NEOP|nr:hypothetical protein K1T71_013529 [Dendrolimus kikuchii]
MLALWSGVDLDERASGGVGVLLSSRFVSGVKAYCLVNPRLLWVRLKLGITRVFLVAAYAPVSSADPQELEKFWESVREILDLAEGNERLIMCGDLNGWVGTKRDGLEAVLGPYGDKRVNDAGLCDYQHDLGHDAVMGPWLKQYFSKLKDYFPDLQINNISRNFVPRWKVKLLKNKLTVHTKKNDDIYFCKQRNYNFCQAVLFNVESNIRTTSVDHFQDVSLIKLSNKTEIPLNYDPGDVFNIRPRNSEEDIEDLFNIFDSHGIDIKPHYRLLVEECHEVNSSCWMIVGIAQLFSELQLSCSPKHQFGN